MGSSLNVSGASSSAVAVVAVRPLRPGCEESEPTDVSEQLLRKDVCARACVFAHVSVCVLSSMGSHAEGPVFPDRPTVVPRLVL